MLYKNTLKIYQKVKKNVEIHLHFYGEMISHQSNYPEQSPQINKLKFCYHNNIQNIKQKTIESLIAKIRTYKNKNELTLNCCDRNYV